jgi:recombinational DNA repair protein RecR
MFPWWLASAGLDERVVDGLKQHQPRFVLLAHEETYEGTATLGYIRSNYRPVHTVARRFRILERIRQD